MSDSDQVFHFVANALECDVETLNMHSCFGHHPKWDSLGHLRLLMSIENRFAIEMDDYAATQYADMAAISALFSSAISSDGATER